MPSCLHAISVLVTSSVAMRVRGIDRVVQRVRVDDSCLATRTRRQLMMVVVMMDMGMRQTAQLISEDARNGTNTGNVRLVADILSQQTIANLPRENARVLLLQLTDVVDHFRGSYTWFRAPDRTGQD